MTKLSMEELVPLIIEVTESGAEFKLYPHGQSMLPTLDENTDSVMLGKPENLCKYDVVLYKRDNGQYVLHRIVAVKKNTFNMCGDNQLEIEKGVLKDSIIAKMTGVFRNEIRIDINSGDYKGKIKKLYRGKVFKRAVNRIKKLLYPVYRIFKKK